MLGWLILLAGSAVLSYAIFEGERRLTSSGSGRADQEMRGHAYGWGDYILGMVLMAVGTVGAFVVTLRARWATRIAGWSLLVVPSAAIVGYSLIAVAPTYRHLAWQRDLSAKMRLKFGDAAGGQPLPLIRDKVLVWDCTSDEPNNLVPRDRQAKSTDGKFTMVLVVAAQDQEKFKYNNGTSGIQRKIKVVVVDWPEETLLGVYEVQGGRPGEFEYVAKDFKGPVVGSTHAALAHWMTQTVPTERQTSPDRERLQGTWLLVKKAVAGKTWEGEALKKERITLSFKDNQFERHDRGTFSLDATKTPRQISFSVPQPLSPVAATSRAIYRLEGDTLTICEAPPRSEPPTQFHAASDATLYVYERAAAKPADKNKTDGKDQPTDVVAAWRQAGATHGWYLPNSPGPGDWLYSEKKPAAADALPVFTWSSLGAGTIKGLPAPKVRFAISLYGVKLPPGALKEIAGLSNLELLYLSRSTITDEGLKELAGLENLHTLFLINTRVTDLGLNELVALKGLQGLHLSGTAVTDAGMKDLARLANLRYLGLNDTAVTDAGLKDLAKLKLRALFLYGTTVTDAAKAELRQAIPDLKIAP